MANYNDKIYLSQAQLETLANGGSITGGGATYTGDENVVYLVPKNPPVITGSGAPTSSTSANFVGQTYIDLTNQYIYTCTLITSTGGTTTYSWVSNLLIALDYTTT